jgi:hypothetical protein
MAAQPPALTIELSRTLRTEAELLGVVPAGDWLALHAIAGSVGSALPDRNLTLRVSTAAETPSRYNPESDARYYHDINWTDEALALTIPTSLTEAAITGAAAITLANHPRWNTATTARERRTGRIGGGSIGFLLAGLAESAFTDYKGTMAANTGHPNPHWQTAEYVGWAAAAIGLGGIAYWRSFRRPAPFLPEPTTITGDPPVRLQPRGQ